MTSGMYTLKGSLNVKYAFAYSGAGDLNLGVRMSMGSEGLGIVEVAWGGRSW